MASFPPRRQCYRSILANSLPRSRAIFDPESLAFLHQPGVEALQLIKRFRPPAKPKPELLRALAATQRSAEARTNREPVKVSLPRVKFLGRNILEVK